MTRFTLRVKKVRVVLLTNRFWVSIVLVRLLSSRLPKPGTRRAPEQLVPARKMWQ